MPSPMNTPEQMLAKPSPTVLAAVEGFLDAHYTFRHEDKYKGFFGKIKAFYQSNLEEEQEKEKTRERYYEPSIFYSGPVSKEKQEQDRLKAILERSFSVALMQLIEAKGKDHVELYKRANIDRKLFSKIRTQHEYIPSKKTIIALALALELTLDETQALLKRAGFTLSRSILFDVIIEYFITEGNYDMLEINSVLFAYKQPILG